MRKRLNKDRHELIRKVNPNSVVRQIDVLDLKKALRSRRSGGDDEQGSGGLWDLAFEETLSYLFYEIGLTDLTDAEHHEYTLLAEEVYNILVLNHYVFNDEENDINIGTVVKILQKNAPYNSYGKIGTVVDIDYEEAEIWYQVQFDKPNPETPYETWVRGQDLQVLNENTLNKNKTLTEATTGFTIEYPNGEFYIGKPMDLYVLMTDFLINWDEDKTTMTEHEAENVASIRENYKEVFYAALEGGNYWKGQEFEEAFGRFSDYEIANALSINESKTLNEGTINFTYSNYDLPTYVLDLDEYLDEYYDEADKYFFEEETMRELVKMVKLANQELKEQQSRLVSELNNKEVAQVLEELGHGLYDDDDYNRDALEYEELLELAVWPGYYQGVSIGFNNVDPDLIRMRTEGTPTVKNFANSLISKAEDLLAEIAEEINMRKARSGGWAGPVYLDEAKSKLNKNKRKKLNKNKTLTEALDYNEEFDEVIFELYYERIEDGTDIKELEDARKLLKTYNLNFKEEVKRGWPVFVIQDNLDKVVDFIADYMGYYGEELIEMLQDSVEPVGGGEIPEEELFILVTLKGLL